MNRFDSGIKIEFSPLKLKGAPYSTAIMKAISQIFVGADNLRRPNFKGELEAGQIIKTLQYDQGVFDWPIPDGSDIIWVPNLPTQAEAYSLSILIESFPESFSGIFGLRFNNGDDFKLSFHSARVAEIGWRRGKEELAPQSKEALTELAIHHIQNLPTTPEPHWRLLFE